MFAVPSEGVAWGGLGASWRHHGWCGESVLSLSGLLLSERLATRGAKPKEIGDTVPRAWEPPHPLFAQAHKEENVGTKTGHPPLGSALKDPLRSSDCQGHNFPSF